jgi:putative nucleotidyltransferase with HDIG domain
MASSPSRALSLVTPAWRPEQLPPFPAVALNALTLVSGRDTSLPALCSLVRSDPAFSSAILKIANSPLVAFSRNITNVMQASMVLGFRRLKCVVITVGLKSYLEGSPSLLMRSCWQHSVACGMIAERAAAGSGFDTEFAYTAGVMHDIGRAAMVAAAPQEYARVTEEEADEPGKLLPRERELFGVDHCEAGAALVKTWNLPEDFLGITACHHDPFHRDPGVPARGAATLIAPSCRLADALGFALAKYPALRYAEVVSTFPEAAQRALPREADVFVAEIAEEIRAMEVV